MNLHELHLDTGTDWETGVAYVQAVRCDEDGPGVYIAAGVTATGSSGAVASLDQAERLAATITRAITEAHEASGRGVDATAPASESAAGTFIARPVAVEAVQWSRRDQDLSLMAWVVARGGEADRDEGTAGAGGPDGDDWGLFTLDTPAGTVAIAPRAWIVFGPTGAFRVMTESEFAAAYAASDH